MTKKRYEDNFHFANNDANVSEIIKAIISSTMLSHFLRNLREVAALETTEARVEQHRIREESGIHVPDENNGCGRQRRMEKKAL